MPGGNGKLAVVLAQNGRLTVHALGEDARQLAAARTIADEAGIMGRTLYIEQGTAASTCTGEWDPDIVVVADAADSDLAALPAKEIRRIYALSRSGDYRPDERLWAGIDQRQARRLGQGAGCTGREDHRGRHGAMGLATIPPLKGGDEVDAFLA